MTITITDSTGQVLANVEMSDRHLYTGDIAAAYVKAAVEDARLAVAAKARVTST